VKRKKRSKEPAEIAERILNKAEIMLTRLKLPGQGDWVTLTVIALIPLNLRGMRMRNESDALPPEAESEPDWEECAHHRISFHVSDIHQIEEIERGTAIIRHSMGPIARILVKESWDEVHRLCGVTPTMEEPAPAMSGDVEQF
jgi:hypothetical protein